MGNPLRSVKAKNFRSLADVDVDFGDFTVLIGPNGSGKSNLLKVLSFVRDTARFDISQAISQAGGFSRVLRQSPRATRLSLTIEGEITENATGNAKDSYTLELAYKGNELQRHEEFTFKRKKGRGRRYTLTADGQEVSGDDPDDRDRKSLLRLSSDDVSALGALARVESPVGSGPKEFFSFLSQIRYLDPQVAEAKAPSRIAVTTLDDAASNLAAALYTLWQSAPDSFTELTRDLGRCLPGLSDIRFEQVGGSASSVVVQLIENGLSTPIDLADASFGTVRMLALLAALHEPDPPALTIIEEVDHGLHPYALDVLVDRLRTASKRTQIIVASHSPTLVNRLEPSEIIICDRNDETGESLIPATSSDEIAGAVSAGDWRAGELWFSGVLGGVPL